MHYFEDFFASNTSAAIGSSFGLLGGAAAAKHQGVAIDTKTGVTIVLNSGNMYKLLEPHPTLLKAYKKATKSRKALRYCMERINEAE